MYIYTRPSHPLNVQSSLENFHPHTRIRDFDTYFSPRLPPPPFAFFQPAIHPCSFSFYHHNDSERYEFDEIRVAVEWPTWTCWSRLVKDISHIFFRDVSLPDIHTQRQGITFFCIKVSRFTTRSIWPPSRHQRRSRSPSHRLRHPFSSRIRNLLLHRQWRTRTVSFLFFL